MKKCLGLLALLRGEPIDVAHLIYENIKYTTNVAQRACGHFCVINELCRRVWVPIYSDDDMIGPKTPRNASIVRSLQHNHPTREAQQDQKDNPAGNEKEFYQPRVQQQST